MSGSAVTPPKGHATRPRNDGGRRRASVSAKLQWTLVIVAVLLVFAAIFYFGRDVKSDLNGAGVPIASAGTTGVVSAHDV